MRCIPTQARQVDFHLILERAEMCRLSYSTERKIKKKLENRGELFFFYSYRLMNQFFLVVDHQNKSVVVVVRGTRNITNAITDVIYKKVVDEELGLVVHKGFKEATDIVLEKVGSCAKENGLEGYTFHFTGHSLGAAIVNLLFLKMEKRGYRTADIITFGQPKFTNKDGAEKLKNKGILRVSFYDDVVAIIPSDYFLKSKGEYVHCGDEILIYKGPYYASLKQSEDREGLHSNFWGSRGYVGLRHHFMRHYVKHIKSKTSYAVQKDFCRGR